MQSSPMHLVMINLTETRTGMEWEKTLLFSMIQYVKKHFCKRCWYIRFLCTPYYLVILFFGIPIAVLSDFVVALYNIGNGENMAKQQGGKCKHSYIDAHGVGGGHIFKYCNKCGKTK